MDLIFHNGRILTMDQDQQEAEAVAVKNDKITAVGSNEEILALKEAGTEVINLKGRSLLPGFNDSHMHLVEYAENQAKVDLRYCKSVEEVTEAIRNFINERDVKKGEWVYGWGWDHGLFQEKRMLNRFDLDRASSEHSIAITRTCCHIMAVNTLSLQKIGIEQKPPTVDGGNVDTDEQGVPTGILEEKAMQLVNDLKPPLDGEALKDLIKLAARDFLSAGLTSVQTDDLAFLGSDLMPVLSGAYQELESAGELNLRVNLQCLLPTVAELQAALDRGYRTGQGGPYFKIGPLKLLTDGSLGGRTALLSEPYDDISPYQGIEVLPVEVLEALVNLASQRKMQVAIHAIGDLAVERVLNAYEKAARRYPQPDPRYRVIHASMATDELLERFKQLDVIADIQPPFIPSDYRLVDQHLGEKRATWTYRWKDFVNRGIKLAGSSDCPVDNYPPLEGIHAAVTRQDKDGNPPGGWHPEQSLSLGEALYIYTMGSAYSSFEENDKGSITAGKLADLVVLSDDLTGVELDHIKNLQVDLTVIGGKIVFSR
ncbi:MAG: amidohydrolase [Bacillota bacterium]